MKDIFTEEEQKKLEEDGGITQDKDKDGYSPEEVERAVTLLKSIAEAKQDGFFFVITRTEQEDGDTLAGVGKIRNTSRFKVLRTVCASLQMTPKKLRAFANMMEIEDDE